MGRVHPMTQRKERASKWVSREMRDAARRFLYVRLLPTVGYDVTFFRFPLIRPSNTFYSCITRYIAETYNSRLLCLVHDSRLPTGRSRILSHRVERVGKISLTLGSPCLLQESARIASRKRPSDWRAVESNIVVVVVNYRISLNFESRVVPWPRAAGLITKYSHRAALIALNAPCQEQRARLLCAIFHSCSQPP